MIATRQLVFALAGTVVASQALAQSAVRIYGVMDAGLAHSKAAGGSMTILGSSHNLASRLGFSGSEDLGGGLRANFALESGINLNDGTGQASNTNNQRSGATTAGPLTFNRQSWVGLQSERLGELRFGRNFSPTFRSHVNYDPFFGGGVGASQAAMGGIGAYGHPAGLRISNAVEYWSPQTLPFRVHAAHALGDNPGNGTAPRTDGNYSGLRASYVDGPLDIGIAYGVHQLASVGDVKEATFGLKYRMGDTTLHGMYVRNTTGSADKMHGALLGVNHRIGVVEVRASYSTSDRESAAGVDIGSVRKAVVGLNYHLSKRTAVYAIYAHNKNADGAASIPWAGTARNAANGTARVLSTGIISTF